MRCLIATLALGQMVGQCLLIALLLTVVGMRQAALADPANVDWKYFASVHLDGKSEGLFYNAKSIARRWTDPRKLDIIRGVSWESTQNGSSLSTTSENCSFVALENCTL
jgi:hypothetical protein